MRLKITKTVAKDLKPETGKSQSLYWENKQGQIQLLDMFVNGRSDQFSTSKSNGRNQAIADLQNMSKPIIRPYLIQPELIVERTLYGFIDTIRCPKRTYYESNNTKNFKFKLVGLEGFEPSTCRL